MIFGFFLGEIIVKNEEAGVQKKVKKSMFLMMMPMTPGGIGLERIYDIRRHHQSGDFEESMDHLPVLWDASIPSLPVDRPPPPLQNLSRNSATESKLG
jgi:hypothetical protein